MRTPHSEAPVVCEVNEGGIHVGIVPVRFSGVQEIEQLYCPNDKMFLPDRFVKGECPKCSTKDQYGDSCDKCGATYSPKDLKGPQCALCETTPILKKSKHVLFQLNKFRDMLKEWLPKDTAPEVSAKMMERFHEDLLDWDIARDAPYFGF